MKKTAAFLLAVLFLTGCGAPPEPQNYEEKIRETLSGSYRMELCFTYDTVEGSALLDKEKDGEMTLALQSPAGMEGLLLRTKGEELTLSYEGIELAMPACPLPRESLPTLLREALSGEGPFEVTEEDGILTAVARNLPISYTITFREEDMTPLSLETAELPLRVEIKSFTHEEAL